MREIKFRAWDNDNQRMVNNAVIFYPNFEKYHINSSAIYMQYTGLKDKNGKEIYEGDILKCHIFTQELGENLGVTEGEKQFIAEVCEMGVMGFQVTTKSNESGNLFWYDNFEDPEEQLEVIGNIYENPELLEVK